MREWHHRCGISESVNETGADDHQQIEERENLPDHERAEFRRRFGVSKQCGKGRGDCDEDVANSADHCEFKRQFAKRIKVIEEEAAGDDSPGLEKNECTQVEAECPLAEW